MTAANTTRQRLLDTALVLFAERGVEAVSLRSINAAAGVSPGILHYHFGNRDTLLDALLHRDLPVLAARRSARIDAIAADDGVSPLNVANALFAPYRDHLNGDATNAGPFLRLLARLVLDGSSLPQTVDSTRAGDFARLADMLALIVPGLDHKTAARRLAVGADMALFTTASWATPAAVEYSERSLQATSLVSFIAAGLGAPA